MKELWRLAVAEPIATNWWIVKTYVRFVLTGRHYT